MLKRPHFASVFLPLLFATVAQTNPIQMHSVSLNMENTYGELHLRLSGDADYDGFNANNFYTVFTNDDVPYGSPGYLLGEILAATSTIHFPLKSATVAPDGDTVMYRFAAGGTWTMDGMEVKHPDGTTHVGSFHATLGEFDIDTYKDNGASEPALFNFYDGEFDPMTASLLGLPGRHVEGYVEWFFDVHNPEDFGSEEYVITPFGDARFGVPEPSLIALLGVGVIAAARRGWRVH
jgi:hypothetical protein